jgi:hypothetical protein
VGSSYRPEESGDAHLDAARAANGIPQDTELLDVAEEDDDLV